MSQPVTLETMRTTFVDTLLAMEHKPIKSETKTETPQKDGILMRLILELDDGRKVTLEDDSGTFYIRMHLGRRTAEENVSCPEDVTAFMKAWIGMPKHVRARKDAEETALRARLAPEVRARVDIMFEELLPEHGPEVYVSRDEKKEMLAECIRGALDAQF